MLLLDLLPTELFLEVLHFLDGNDLQTLRSMSEFKDTLGPLLFSITDQNLLTEPIEIPSNAMFVIVDTLDPTKCKQGLDYLQKSSSNVHLNINTSYTADGQHIFFPPELMKFLYRYEFRSITFTYVSRLSIAGVRLDPRVLRLPKVRQLSLLSCFVKGTGLYKFDFPSLEKLHVRGHFDQINKSLVYESLCLKELELISVDDVKVWEDVYCPSLRSLKIIKTNKTRFGMKGMRNITLQNLEVFDTISCDIESFSCLKLAKLEEWEISGHVSKEKDRAFYFDDNVNPCNITLHDIDAPHLKKIAIGCADNLNVIETSFPSLQSAWLVMDHPMHLEDGSKKNWEWLNMPIDLYVDGCEIILKYVPQITELELAGRMPMEECLLPNLKKLIIHYFDELEEYPDLGFNEQVTNLQLLSDCPESEIKCVYEIFPNLETLTTGYENK